MDTSVPFAGLWNVLKDVKPLWTEPRDSGDLEKTIHEYYASIKKQSGGMYIAVCRGKVRSCTSNGCIRANLFLLLYASHTRVRSLHGLLGQLGKPTAGMSFFSSFTDHACEYVHRLLP